MKYFFNISIFLILIILYGCAKPEDVISPTHYDRVPQPKNLSAQIDTTASGKNKITLTWGAEGSNIKDFTVYRAINQSTDFSSIALGLTDKIYTDTTNQINSADTLNIFYYINTKGKDSFYSQNSDTIQVALKK